MKKQTWIKTCTWIVAGVMLSTFPTAHAASTQATDYVALRNQLDLFQLSTGDVVTVTAPGIAGNFVIRTGSTTDNGGTLIQGLSNTSIHAERVFDGPLNVKWFGAIGDGIANDRDEIQTAIDLKGNIYIPPGTYLITESLVIPIVEGMKISGAGQDLTEIKNESNTTADTLRLVGTGSTVGTRVAFVEISNMTLRGHGNNGHGIYLDFAYENTLKQLKIIENINPGNEGQGIAPKDGIHLKRGFYNEMLRITAQANGRDGIHIGLTGNGNVIANGHFGGSPQDGNKRAGVYVGTDTTYTPPANIARTHGVQIVHNVFESNHQYNILIDNADSCLISGNYIEGATLPSTQPSPLPNNYPSSNAVSQVYITNSTGDVSLANVIRDNDFSGDILDIEVDGAQSTVISGNGIQWGITLYASATATKVTYNALPVWAPITDWGSGTVLLHNN